MDDVRRQLIVFERNGRILKWHDRQIPPGSDWRNQIDRRLNLAQIVLLFLSPHFIESRYCYEVEGEAALRRRESQAAEVIPIILRPCPWQETPFGMLQALPRDAVPVSRWPDRDEACLNVATGVMAPVDRIIKGRHVPPVASKSAGFEPDETDTSILLYVANAVYSAPWAEAIAEQMNIHPQITHFRLNRLEDNHYIYGSHDIETGLRVYEMADKGRALLIEKNLIT